MKNFWNGFEKQAEKSNKLTDKEKSALIAGTAVGGAGIGLKGGAGISAWRGASPEGKEYAKKVLKGGVKGWGAGLLGGGLLGAGLLRAAGEKTS